jgi:hypothetical protein
MIPDSLPDRLRSRIAVDERGCWVWTRGKTGSGYAAIKWDRRQTLVHRLVFSLITGQEIPKGQQLDHLCRVRHCVNPAHLEVVSGRVNNLRGESPAARNARKVECIRGHRFTSESTYITPRGERACRPCNALRTAQYTLRQRGMKS